MTELKRLSEPRDFIKQIYNELDELKKQNDYLYARLENHTVSQENLWKSITDINNFLTLSQEKIDSLQSTVSMLQSYYGNLLRRHAQLLDIVQEQHQSQAPVEQQAQAYTQGELEVLVERYK